LQYVNVLRVLSLLSVKAFLAIYYSIVPIVITLNAFLPLGLIFRTVYWIETVNNRIIGYPYILILVGPISGRASFYSITVQISSYCPIPLDWIICAMERA